MAGYMARFCWSLRKTVPTGTLIAVIVDKLDEIRALNDGMESVAPLSSICLTGKESGPILTATQVPALRMSTGRPNVLI